MSTPTRMTYLSHAVALLAGLSVSAPAFADDFIGYKVEDGRAGLVVGVGASSTGNYAAGGIDAGLVETVGAHKEDRTIIDNKFLDFTLAVGLGKVDGEKDTTGAGTIDGQALRLSRSYVLGDDACGFTLGGRVNLGDVRVANVGDSELYSDSNVAGLRVQGGYGCILDRTGVALALQPFAGLAGIESIDGGKYRPGSEYGGQLLIASESDDVGHFLILEMSKRDSVQDDASRLNVTFESRTRVGENFYFGAKAGNYSARGVRKTDDGIGVRETLRAGNVMLTAGGAF